MRTSVDVHNYLVERDIRHELVNVRGRLRSPERIASVLGLEPSEVGKVVVYEADGGPVAALVASDRDPDPERVRRAVKAEDLRRATPSRASQLSEFLGEAVPPVALPASFRVVMDRPLAADEVLYFAAGEASAVLKIRGPDLARASRAKLAAISPRPAR
jgi:prolyl-tRNA editing enzyme YbaK/EbsC (Cys-tRNA(Pro) deacylase)